MELRPYQQESINAVYRYLHERDDNPCVVIPTGGGKTPVMAAICRDAVIRWDGRVLILAHVKELLEQTVDAIQITERQANGNGDPPAKECPEYRAVIHAAYSVCPDCGYEFPPPENGKHDTRASDEGILTGQVIDTEYDVQDVFYSVHTKRGAGEDVPKTMRITYQVGLNDFQSEWVCPEHDGWARQKFEQWWLRRSNDPLPDTAERAVGIAEAGGVATVHKITVRKVTGEKFDRIVACELGEKPEPVPLDGMGRYDPDEIPF